MTPPGATHAGPIPKDWMSVTGAHAFSSTMLMNVRPAERAPYVSMYGMGGTIPLIRA
jgi:hypothetical protein